PRSLFGRVALVVFAGLATAHALTFWALLRERGELSRTMMLAYLGRDVATSVAILDRVPAAERTTWLPRLARQNYGYAMSAAPTGMPADSGLTRQLSGIVPPEPGAGRAGALARRAAAGNQPLLHLPLRLPHGTPL